MKLTKEIRINLGVGGENFTSVFRRPTNQELNEFFNERFGSDKKGDAVQARAAFYDKLLTGIEDLEADGAPVTPERKDLIPEAWKGLIVFEAFENVKVSEKN